MLRAEELIKRVDQHSPSLLGKEHYREYGILIPLIMVKGEIHLLFEVRAMNMRSQPGDVCFPGGRMEDGDINPEACAVRETCEEIGLTPSQIHNIHKLGHVISEGRIIHLFTGFIPSEDPLNPDPGEVDHVFTAPLDYFMTTTPERYQVGFRAIPEKDFPLDLIQGGENYNWQKRYIEELFFKYEDKVIWGLTAYLITRLINIVKP
ncbi:Peroxisomal coenzyme A diphosphatase NUDT7 [Lentibacillus sp. JNUCC-1]|uniref:NUDIX hydrolase n=1 Tax=Lentibacillus sp. JNUCC-1 TaxID=2654513 RepID=UPI001328B114|nr:CoA pyrophosphatase [Lentibacillus sp. JNUCC-1]MUV36699.1 Peroxisomal coenzyme A diphosphatase NUDT7 [Lentibacillus sp. JNUCC-1]